MPPILCELVNLAIIAPRAHRILPIRYRAQFRQWWSLLREALPLSIGAAFATLTYRIDSVMLAELDDWYDSQQHDLMDAQCHDTQKGTAGKPGCGPVFLNPLYQ